MTFATTTRNADITDMISMLQSQQARKIDVVAPASALRSVEGVMTVKNTEVILTEDGVTQGDGSYIPTAVFDEGLADKLGVPVGYLKRLRTERPDMYDANVNGWLHGRNAKVNLITQEVLREPVPADPRQFLLRAFRGDDGQPGIARAFLSDRYSVVDNLDVLMAALDGIRDAGVKVQFAGGDITERRMVVRVSCPEVSALAPVLLDGYRSPFTGQYGSDNPTVFAGSQISNSEVGGGAFTITPRLVVQVCSNGLTMTRDSMQKVHLGGRLDAGVVRWAEDTTATAVTLIKKQARDAVRAFLSPEYLTEALSRLSINAAQKVENHEEVKVLAKRAKFTDSEIDGILGYFTQGGQMNRAGIMNAVTAYSQTVEDGDQAYTLEARAGALLDLR